MSMYDPEVKSRSHFLILIVFGLTIALLFIKLYKQIIIETGCSNVASTTSSILGKTSIEGAVFSYESIKQNCIYDSNYSK